MFGKVTENQITKAIVQNFSKDMNEFLKTDVIIVGGGPSGLMAARELALQGHKVLVMERNNYLGGGFWVGGFLMNTVTFRNPSQEILDDLGIPYEFFEENIFTACGPHACSKLIASACDAGVKILNMVSIDDVIVKNDKVCGVVVNWTPVSSLPRQITCVDPISIESKVVVDATGHDAVVVKKIEEKGLIEPIPGQGNMWVEASEDKVVEKTGFVYPGLMAVGMAVSSTYGLPRMGPTFGSMLFSGKKGGALAHEHLCKTEDQVMNY